MHPREVNVVGGRYAVLPQLSLEQGIVAIEVGKADIHERADSGLLGFLGVLFPSCHLNSLLPAFWSLPE